MPGAIELPDPPHVRPRRVGLLLGLPGLWLLPKTTGPHLAVGSLSKAVHAYLVALIGGACGMVLAGAWLSPAEGFPGDFGLIDRARLLVARRVVEAAAAGRPEELLVIPGVVIGSLISVALVTLALVPWLAAGDTAKSVYRRSLRLTCWLTTLVIPAEFLFAALVRLGRQVDVGAEQFTRTAATGAAIAYVLWAALRSGLRYAGPPEGPGFGPVEPRCEECGYRLCGLSVAQRCPECGLSVRQSLRRYEPPAPARRSAGARVVCHLRLIPRVIRHPKEVFNSLRLRHDFATARAFWLTSWLGLAAVVTAISAVSILLSNADDPGQLTAAMGLAAVLSLLGVQALMGMVCALGTALRRERADLRIAATALSYGSAMLWPAALWLLGAELLLGHLESLLWLQRPLAIPTLQRTVSVTAIGHLVTFFVLVLLLGLWAYYVDKGYRSLRHTSG